MTFSGDPYRTLGLLPGASLDDVKRAYRRLAKQYHPDAAGPEAVARFLAVQDAYETLAGPARRARRVPRSDASRPSQADPERARATRDAYRARRGTGWGTRTEPRTDSGRDEAWWQQPRSGPGRRGPAGGSGRRDAAASASGTSSGEGERPRRRRPTEDPGAPNGGSRAAGDGTAHRGPNRRKATLSSTSYDDAASEPRHPEWQGSSWYGTSSGTYWTINPREYADPRKHGPEYQARARRAAADGRPDTMGADPAHRADVAPGGQPAWGDPGGGQAPPVHASTERPPASSSTEAADLRGSVAFTAAAGQDGTGWSDVRPGAADAAVSPPSGSTPAPSVVPTAGSIGLASGAIVAVPAVVVVLGSTMGGDLSTAALALAAPVVVAAAVGLGLGLVRRGRG